MSDSRFRELMGRLLDEELEAVETSELIELVREDPRRKQELQTQLEAAELLTQVESELRKSSLFVAATQNRLDEDLFVVKVNSAILQDVYSVRRVPTEDRKPLRWHWILVATAIAASLTIGTFFASKKRNDTKPQNDPETTVSRGIIARIVTLNGSVRWTGDGGLVNRDLEVGQPLSGGTLEPLSADSWAKIEFTDGSTVTVFGRSVLTISELQQKELHLKYGGLSATIKPQPEGRPMLIHAPTAELEVLGTQFNMNAEPSSTVLNVNEGRVRVKRLADGSVTEVPAGHQIIASTNRQDSFKPIINRRSVNHWQSKLPEGILYGKWLPGTNGGLRAKPMLWHDCKKKKQKPVVLFLTSLLISRGDHCVTLQREGTFRIRGRLKSPADVVIGLTTKYPKGGFAGKFIAYRHADTIRQANGIIDIEIPMEDFRPQEPEHAKSPIGLEIFDFWCLTIKTDASLIIESVELISTKQNQN